MSDDLPIQPKLPAGQAAPQAPTPEETGTQALSEALQSSFFLVKIVMWVLLAVFLSSGFFTVKDGQKAIKLRFGKPVGEGEQALLGPGAHWAFPAPIDEVRKVSLGKREEASATVGLPASPSGGFEDPPARVAETLNPAFDGYALSADINIVHVSAKLYYKVTDPIRYLFDFTHAPVFVTNALNNAILYAASRYTVDQILINPAAFRESVEKRTQELIDEQQLGIAIDQLVATPYAPRKLKDTFEEVSRARANRVKANNEAESYTNQVITKAFAEAHSKATAAQVESERYVEIAQEEARQFCNVLPKFQDDPSLYLNLRLAQTMGRVLTNAEEKVFIPRRVDGKPRELRLQLSREPRETAPTTAVPD